MADFHAFTRDVIALRRRQPALRSGASNVYSVDRLNRVVAVHRWVPDVGHDVVVLATFSETTLHPDGYRIGFPLPGLWHEVLNSDAYDHAPNPWVQGNGGTVVAAGPPMHGLPYSATVVIPANSLLVLARTA
jgi:1,4-alpha-glucan branching enzyme